MDKSGNSSEKFLQSQFKIHAIHEWQTEPVQTEYYNVNVRNFN